MKSKYCANGRKFKRVGANWLSINPVGRVRYWVYVPELEKCLRVVTLEDGETVLNAFPDRDFQEANL